MKIKKLSIIITFMIILNIIMTNYVYADSVSVNMKSSSLSYKRGQVVTVDISLSNISSTSGISKLSGIIGYDTNVFEKIEKTSISTVNDWKNVEFNSETNEFSVTTNNPVKSSQTIMKVNFKVKDNAKLGDTFIMLTEMHASNSGASISTSPATLSISIKEDTTAVIVRTTPDSNIITIEPSPLNVKTTSSPIAKASPTPTDGKLPQTGINDTNVIVLLVGAIILSIGTFIMYRKNCK